MLMSPHWGRKVFHLNTHRWMKDKNAWKIKKTQISFSEKKTQPVIRNVIKKFTLEIFHFKISQHFVQFLFLFLFTQTVRNVIMKWGEQQQQQQQKTEPRSNISIEWISWKAFFQFVCDFNGKRKQFYIYTMLVQTYFIVTLYLRDPVNKTKMSFLCVCMCVSVCVTCKWKILGMTVL